MQVPERALPNFMHIRTILCRATKFGMIRHDGEKTVLLEYVLPTTGQSPRGQICATPYTIIPFDIGLPRLA